MNSFYCNNFAFTNFICNFVAVMCRSKLKHKVIPPIFALLLGLILQWGTFVSLTHHHHQQGEVSTCSHTHSHPIHSSNEEAEDCSLCLAIVQYGVHITLPPTSLPTPWVSCIDPNPFIPLHEEPASRLMGRLHPRAPPCA